MTDLDITAIREALELATDGENWTKFLPSDSDDWVIVGSGDESIATVQGMSWHAEFIERAPETIRALLAALESSRAVVERLQGELDAERAEHEDTATEFFDLSENSVRLYDEQAATIRALRAELDAQTVEWGTEHPHNGRVIGAKDEHEAVRDARIFPGFKAVSRKVSPWLPVPTDGAEN